MPNINQLLIKALYNEYDPNVDINAQINFVNENYTSQDKFVEDFYKEYGTELTPEIKLFINQNFGGFEPVAKPTIDVDDYDVSMSPEGATVAAENKLSEGELRAIDQKFSDISYFDKLVYEFQPIGDNIFEKGMNVGDTEKQKIVETDTLQMYEDLKITKDDHNKNVEKEYKKLLEPHAYNLSESEIEKLNDIRRELISQGFKGEILEKALFEEAQKLVLENYKYQYIYSVRLDKVNRYLSDRADLFSVKGPSLKRGVSSYKDTVFPVSVPMRETPDYDEFKDLQGIIFKDVEKFQEVNKTLKEDYEENQELGREILAYRERASQPGFEFDSEEAIAMQKKLALYRANKKVLLEVLPDIQLATGDMETLNVAAGLLGKDYDTLNKNMATVVLGFGDLGLGAMRIMSGAGNLPITLGAIPLPDAAKWAENRTIDMDNLSLKWDNFKAGVKNTYKPDIKFENAFDSLDNFGEFAMQEISTQIPIFTTMIAGGGLAGWTARKLGVSGTVKILGRNVQKIPLIEATGAGAWIGGASGGQQYNTMTAQEMRDPFLEYSEAEKFLVSAGYGAAEGIFGTAPSYMLLRNTAKFLLRDPSKQAWKISGKQFFKNNIAFPVIAEPVSEGLTMVSQNWLLGRPLMENVDHAMFSGLMFSIIMNAAPATAGRMMQDFSSFSDMKKFNEINSEMNAIEKALNRKNSKFKKGTTEYNSLVNSYNQLKTDREAIINDLYNNITTKMSKRAFKQFMENTVAQQDIRIQAQKIYDEAGGMFLSADDTRALNALQKEFDKYQFARDLFRSQENFGNEFANLKGKDSNLYDTYIKKAKQKLKRDGINDPNTTKVFQEASSIYFADQFDLHTKNAKGNELQNIKVFETNQDLIKFIEQDPKRKAELDKKGKRWIIENGKIVYKTTTSRDAILRGDINGINTEIKGKNFELISKENALANERAGTGYHEFAHSVLFKALAANPEQYLDIAKTIKDYIKDTDKKLYNIMFKSGGGQQADITNPEEVIVNFLERIAEGKVKDPKLIGVIAESLSKKSGMDINFRSELDTIKFLYDIGMKIKNGTFKRSDLKSIRVNLRGKLNQADADVKKLIDGMKFSDSTIKPGSDADIIQKLWKNLGAEAVPQIANNKYIRNVINEILKKYSGVPGFTTYKKEFEDGLINDPVYGILGSLLTYDPKKNPVLASHIIARLRQRSKTIAEDIFPQFFGGDYKETGYDPTDPEVLNQRESLRTALGLNPEIIEKVKQSVIKTFGTRLPKVDSKKFKFALQKAFRTELKKLITDYIGTTKETVKPEDDIVVEINPYKLFLDEYFELAYGIISQGNINKRFEQFSEEVFDPKKGKRARESTPEGNTIFIKRDITKEEWMNYFLGDDVKPSTKGTRKTALAESLAEEIAFDATLDVLRDEKILDKVQQIVEINGEQFSENYLAQVAKEIDRAVDFEFSDSSAGITVLDFDDTVAISKSKVSVTMPNQSAVYNASPKTFEELGKRTGLIFLATDIREAQEYARMNRGEVKQFSINNSSLAVETQVLDIMKQLKIDTSKGLLYEMIDPRFKNFYIGKKNVNKIKAALKEKGFGGFKYTDGTQVVGGTTQSIAVIDKSIIKQPTKLTATEFAKQHDALKKDGAKFDFSEFNKVIGGEKGPLFNRLQKAVNKFGNKNVFILTARPQEAAPAIKAWLKSQGIALSEKNIIGLSDGSPQAKADWILGKAKEGFNNFYFADDVLENTYAVEQVLSQVDVKYRIDTKFSDSKPNIVNLLESFDGNLGTFVEFFEALIKGQKKYNDITSKQIKDAKGQILEYYVAMEVKGLLGDRVEIVNMDYLKQLKTGDKGIDIRFRVDGGKEFGIEIKSKFTDKVGSKAGYTETNRVLGGEALIQVKNAHEVLLKRTTDVLDKLNIEYYIDKDNDNKLYTEKFINGKKIDDLLKENGVLFSDQQLNFTIDGLETIADIYAEKGGSYIYFDDVGLLSLTNNPMHMGTNKNWWGRRVGGVRSVLNLTDTKGDRFNTEVQPTLKTGKGGNTFYNKKSGKNLKAEDVRTFFVRSYFYIQKADGKRATAKDIDPSININEAFTNFSDSGVNLNNGINNIIEQSSGIKNIVKYSDTKGYVLGAKGFYRNELKGGFIFRFTADDLKGFTYEMMKNIRGEEGNKAKAFFIENLHRPYNTGIQGLNFEMMKMADDIKALKAKYKKTAGKLKKRIKGDIYTNDQAVRIYIWKTQGMDIPGIPKQDIADMVNYVKDDLSLMQFAEEVIKLSGNKGYPAPELNWEAGTIDMDLAHDLNTRRRAEHLKEWQENVDIMFSKKNLNKMRVAYGNEFVEQLEGMLERMRTGKNRQAQNKIVRNWEEWVNGSVGTIMYYNMRSALLQTISMANYINWHDNNLYAAGKAFANQKQYWKDWLMIFNSDYLKIRRGGLQLNINEAELAEAANKGGVKGVTALILKNGFTPTRIADSFAIAMGGASFYRNRVNSLIKKKKMSEAEAKKKAWEDFMELTEEAQQSSRPDKISAQQASPLGRLLLAFANTPMQYNRIIKRAGQDLYYGRGDWRSNLSKIVYYSSLQNFLFNFLQKGVYALGLGLYDDDPDKQKEKVTNVFEGMADSLLRGFGTGGQVVLTAKGFGKDMLKEDQSFYDSDWKNILELSPPIGSKIKKLMSADYLKKTYKNSKQWEEWSIRNPRLGHFAKYSEALFNIPLDRLLIKTHNLQSVFSDETADWQKVALTLGWNEWDLGIEGMDLHSEFGKTPIKTDEYLKEREETKENHQRKIDSIVNLGYTRIPLSGPRSFKPEGEEGVDYIRLKRKLDGKWQYFVPKAVFDKKFPPKKKEPKTVEEILEDARKRLKKKGLTI